MASTDEARSASQRPPEAFVAWAWEHRLAGASLTTSDGRALQVIYPGRRGAQWGPDFRGALLVLAGSVIRGDVEIHVRGRDWGAHGHGSDSAYMSTALHVIFEDLSGPTATRADGTAIPTLALGPQLAEPLTSLLEKWRDGGHRAPDPRPCLTPQEASELLERAGLARFHAKVDRFEADLSCVDPAQALWTGILEALGYTANVRPFRLLAERVSIHEAREMAAAEAEYLEALLLGESGLLPSQRERAQRERLPLDQHAWLLEAAWASMRRSTPQPPLPWRLRGCRPANAPPRRVAAAVALARALPRIEDAALGAVHELPPGHAVRALRRLITRSEHSYWREHADFGRALRRPLALIGPQRAADCVVNALLPWAAAMERTTGGPLAAEAAYMAHPALGENQITRHMRSQVLGPEGARLRLTACRQQGLIAIYRGWCDARDCAACIAGPQRDDGPEILWRLAKNVPPAGRVVC